MIVSGRVLKCLRAFNDPKGFQEISHSVYHTRDGWLYATDTYRIAGVRVLCDHSAEGEFRLPNELFGRLKASDEVEILTDKVKVGRWEIPNDDYSGAVDFSKTLEPPANDSELPENGLPVNPSFLSDACALAAAMGASIRIDEYPDRVIASALDKKNGVEARMAIMGKRD